MLKASSTDLTILKRDGRVVAFDDRLIASAIQKAFCAEHGVAGPEKLEDSLRTEIEQMVAQVVAQAGERLENGLQVTVEFIQDSVERELMRQQFYSVARRYILYREEHNRIRQLRAEESMESAEPFPQILVNRDGRLENLDFERLRTQIDSACRGIDEICDSAELLNEIEKQFYNKITPKEIAKSMVYAARTRIERDPAYDTVAGRLILKIIYREALGESADADRLLHLYRSQFEHFIDEGIAAKRLAPELDNFDLKRISDALVPERDDLFPYLGLQTIYDRYLLHINGRRIEAPQYFWMRVAMGLAMQEGSYKTDRAIEFYHILSTFRVHQCNAHVV